MEYIKKKICLEPFISRIPGAIATIDNEDISNNKNGSWGKIPKTIILWGQEIKYQTLMNLYYSVLKVVTSANYYEYDASGNKWLTSNFDWRDTFHTHPVIKYYSELPVDDLITVLIPTNSPRVFTSAPPELPGLTAASVWINDSTRNSLGITPS